MRIHRKTDVEAHDLATDVINYFGQLKVYLQAQSHIAYCSELDDLSSFYFVR